MSEDVTRAIEAAKEWQRRTKRARCWHSDNYASKWFDLDSTAIERAHWVMDQLVAAIERTQKEPTR